MWTMFYVLKVEEKEYNVIITGNCEENIKDLCEDYFSLKEDYEKVKRDLAKIDDNLKTSIKFGEGIRILHQDLWETLISFIISANNNIPRIKGIIERISKKYGKKIIFEEKEKYRKNRRRTFIFTRSRSKSCRLHNVICPKEVSSFSDRCLGKKSYVRIIF